MTRNLSVKIDDYTLEVEEFEEWIDALADIELGRIKLEIAKVARLGWPFEVSAGLKFSSPSVTSKEQIICALLLKYPKGLSKIDLQSATGMNPDSLATYLTSKQKEIAEGIEKQDDVYVIKDGWLSSAIGIAREALSKSNQILTTETQSEERSSD
ncbi:MAG: hypothetical protein E3J86_07875 [Candidatus Thorarchaeota archaeon]|nr:MAG: hypothetical protein E3J86_07875 [Candidatus Thorarchaeota archaeon]